MDVEGAEMSVLEGMLETIKRNPSLNIITECSLDAFREHGVSPLAFLEKLVDLGFVIHVIDDEKMQVAESADVNSVWKICQSKGITNLFCER
jgi:hypothetical protein